MRQAFLPVFGEQPAATRDLVDIIGKCKCDDVGFEPIDHSSSLLAGAPMRLLDPYFLIRGCRPLFSERSVDILIQLPRGVVGDIEQCHVSLRYRRRQDSSA